MAAIGQGTTIGYADLGESSGFLDLAEVFSVGYPEVTVQDVKTTHYGTTGNFHDYIAGWMEGGEVQVQMNYSKAQQDDLHDIIRVKKSWVITLPDTSTIAFDGYVKRVSAEIPNEDRVVGSCTIKVCSVPVFTEAV